MAKKVQTTEQRFAVLMNGEKLVSSKPVAVKDTAKIGWPFWRAWLEEIFPGKTIASPLDPWPKGQAQATVKMLHSYISPNADGNGRVDSKPELWLVY